MGTDLPASERIKGSRKAPFLLVYIEDGRNHMADLYRDNYSKAYPFDFIDGVGRGYSFDTAANAAKKLVSRSYH